MQAPHTKRISSRSEFDKALQDAQNRQQILIVDFYADWCISCKVIEKEIIKQADVEELLSDFMFVRLDISKNTPEQLALLTQFNLFGPPAILFFKNGENLIQHKLLGEFSKNDFIKHLNALKGI